MKFNLIHSWESSITKQKVEALRVRFYPFSDSCCNFGGYWKVNVQCYLVLSMLTFRVAAFPPIQPQLSSKTKQPNCFENSFSQQRNNGNPRNRKKILFFCFTYELQKLRLFHSTMLCVELIVLDAMFYVI